MAMTVPVTPHASYSSSVGVLGCKIDTNRVAYWPGAVSCDELCVRLSHDGRSLNLLRIDQSAGAHDVSYDAWNYLYTGLSATQHPVAGGAVDMTYEAVDPAQCDGLIHTDGHRLPLSAANSMDFVAECLAQADSWVARNYVLYNIVNPICTLGFDEVCHLNMSLSNQPSCPHQLGLDAPLKGQPVYNIEYPSGKTVLAGQASASSTSAGSSGEGDESAAPARRAAVLAAWTAAVAVVVLGLGLGLGLGYTPS